MQRFMFHFSNGEELQVQSDGYTLSGNSLIFYNNEESTTQVLSTASPKQKVTKLVPLSLVLWVDFLD